MAKNPKENVGDERTPEETERLREATLKKLLSTPPKPFTPPAKGNAKKGKGRRSKHGKSALVGLLNT